MVYSEAKWGVGVGQLLIINVNYSQAGTELDIFKVFRTSAAIAGRWR